jgi:hypothetical protein
MAPGTEAPASLRGVRLVAAARVGFGLVMLAKPDGLARAFGLGTTPGTAILARGIGARDVASGLQVLTTTPTPAAARRFLQGRALVDLLEIGAFAAAARGGRRHWSGLVVPVSAVLSGLGQLRLAQRLGGDT